jgi:hypothetical protein
MNLNEKLTDLTRQIVHLRDASESCIICGCALFEPVEVCHYMKRRHIATTWELSNVNLGHKVCNGREESSEVLQAHHSKNMIARYGNAEVMRLHIEKNRTVKLSKSEKLEKIEQYKAILKSLQ